MGVHDTTLIPQSQVLIVRLPQGAYVWQRPTAVLVKQGEQVRQIPIVAITLLLQLGLLGFSLLMTVVCVVMFVQRKERVPWLIP
jgi:hypothetical protein